MWVKTHNLRVRYFSEQLYLVFLILEQLIFYKNTLTNSNVTTKTWQLNDTDDDTLSLDSCKTMSDGLAELLGELQPLEEDLVDLGDDSESDVPSGEFVQSSPMEPRLIWDLAN